MERVRPVRRPNSEKARAPVKVTRYLLTHPKLGVFLGYTRGRYLWSNLESGGNTSALLLSKTKLDDPFIEEMVDTMSRDFGGGFEAAPCSVSKEENFLPMDECVKMGFSRWCEFPSNYFSSVVH